MRELGRGRDVAGANLGRGHVLFAAREEDLREALLASPAQVGEVGIRLQRAGEHLEIADTTELVAAGAEDEGLDGLVRLDLRRRHELRDRRHQGPHAQQLGRRAAQHRRDLAVEDALAKTALDLVLVEGAGVEVFLEQGVVALRRRLDELAAVLVHALLHVVGDRHLASLAVGRGDERLQVEQVDDAAKVLLGADRKVEGEGARRQHLAHRGHGAVEVRVLLVELVDDDDPWLARSVAVLPCDLRADRQLGGGADDHHRPLRGAKAARDLAGEVEEARRVEQVDLVSVVLREGDAEVDRDLALLLFRLEVHRGGRLVGRPHSRDGAGGEEHGLGKHRLAVVRVAQKDHVADLVRSVVGRHSNPHQERQRKYEFQV